MFKAKIIYISYLLFAMNFTSCTYKDQNHGVNIESNMISQVKENLANDDLTILKLTNILGPNSTVYLVDNNIHILYINLTRVTPPIQKDYISNSIIYEFIASGNKVFKLNEYDSLNEITLNENQTYYEDRNFSILKQIFGNLGQIAGTNHGE
ncbi:MAG: hypothetical protein HOM96_03605 [Rickettsiales bacterium]|jgi:hypothetical protein|nr:hypothetical protein [Rickettsiales bacterium]